MRRRRRRAEDEKPLKCSASRRRAGEGDSETERKPELELDARLTVSDREVLQKKDFAQMTAAEIAAAKDAIKRLVLSLDEVKTRRPRPIGTAISSTSAARCARASRSAAR